MVEEVEVNNYSIQQSHIDPTTIPLKTELEQHQDRVDQLHGKIMEVKTSVHGSKESGERDLDVLWKRVKTTSRLLTYLKSKARVMSISNLAHVSCGIRHQEVLGLIDKTGMPLTEWSTNVVDLSTFESSHDEAWLKINNGSDVSDENDGAYILEILESVRIVTDAMEALFRRVIMAETVAASEKEKVNLSQEEIKKKAYQIECMSARIEEMEIFARDTNSVLNVMRKKVEDMVQETSRQRQRASENEQELNRVKQDFESLRSYVSTLISVRETLVSSEKQFQTMERLFERLVAKTTNLENEKMQKEAEVQQLMAENVRLASMLDKKEAQILAMNEQYKLMALNSSSGM